jgi:hypothetical protein
MNRLVPAILSTCLASTGCTLLLDAGQVQCETTADCTTRGFMAASCVKNVCEEAPAPPPDPTWGCLGHVVAPVPDTTEMVTLSERLVLAVEGTPVTMATVDVCDKLDVDCTATGPGFPKGLTPDANGNVTFSVFQGFDGFVRIAGPTIMDSRVYVGRPIVAPPSVKAVELLQPSDYSALANLAGQTVDMSLGTTIVLGFDCQGLAAAGVSFETPNTGTMTQQFYLINMLPEKPPTATATDVDGFGGFFNMPVGLAVVKSYRAAGDVYIGESSFAVLAYTISYVLVAPTPN